MVQLLITSTGKSYSPKDTFKIICEDTKSFRTVDEAKQYLKETYKGNRSKMYQDGKDGEALHVGYIYHFRTADYSHSPIEHWLQQDWVEFRSVEPIVLSKGI